MTLRSIFYLAVTILLIQPAHGQSTADRLAAMRVVDGFFASLATSDAEALAELLYPGTLNIAVTTQGSDLGLTTRSYDDLLERFAAGPPIIERYWDPTLLIQAGIGVFWAPYDLYINGQFSHCGVDSFQLVKEDGRWWLTNLSWTIERENCTLHPEGPPA